MRQRYQSNHNRVNKRSIYMISAFFLIFCVIVLAIFLGSDLFKGKSYTFDRVSATMTLEDAVKSADNIIVAEIGSKGDVYKEMVASPMTAKDGTKIDSVFYTKVIISTQKAFYGTKQSYVYELGGTYEGIVYKYNNVVTFTQGEEVILLLDNEGFVIGEQFGKFTLNGNQVKNAGDPSFVKTMDEFTQWINDLLKNKPSASPSVSPSVSSSVSPSVTPTQSPAATKNTQEIEIPYISTDDAIKRANMVIRGTVGSIGKVKSYIEEGKTYYYTEVTLNVTGVIVGEDSLKNTSVIIKQLGGTFGNTKYIYKNEPYLETGEDVILILTNNYRIIGGNAGKYNVTKENKVVNALDIDISQFMSDFIMGVDKLQGN